jgi:hypothetical protein
MLLDSVPPPVLFWRTFPRRMSRAVKRRGQGLIGACFLSVWDLWETGKEKGMANPAGHGPLVIGVDGGATACKAIAWNRQGVAVAEGRASYLLLQPEPAWHRAKC